MILKRALVSLVVLSMTLLCNAQLNTTRVMEIGRNALYFDDYVLSIKYFNQVIDAKPFLHEPYFFRALAKYYLEDYTGAEQDLDVAIEKNPYISRSYHLRGLCRASASNFSDAESDLRMALRFNPRNNEVWQNLGAVVMKQKDWKKAEGVLDSMLVVFPRNTAARLMRTQLALNAGDTLKARNMVEQTLLYDKFSPEVYEARAIINMAMGKYQEAEADFNKSIDLMPTHSGVYINRAFARYKRHNYSGAMEDYNTALQVEPGNFTAHYNRALLKAETGDNNSAIEDFDWVLMIDGDNMLARFNRALLREKTGDYKGAVEDFSIVLENYPDFEYGRICRSAVYRKMGNEAAASADEEWLKRKRFFAALNEKDESSAGCDSAEDEARKRSDENIRRYNEFIVSSSVSDDKQYVTEYRGKIQNRNVYVDIEPLFVLTYYEAGQELESAAQYYSGVEEINSQGLGIRKLLLTNDERALASNEVERHFQSIDALSKDIASDSKECSPRLRRALDYYLVQNLEEAMKDADAAVDIAPDSWTCYFIRSFLRYRLLETEYMNENEDEAALMPRHSAGLPDIDYRLVKDDLDRVVELASDFPHAYYNRANVSIKLSDFKSAIVDYTKAIAIDERFAEAYFNRGLARIYTGNSEEGIADLSKAGELGLFHAYSIIKRFKARAVNQ